VLQLQLLRYCAAHGLSKHTSDVPHTLRSRACLVYFLYTHRHPFTLPTQVSSAIWHVVDTGRLFYCVWACSVRGVKIAICLGVPCLDLKSTVVEASDNFLASWTRPDGLVQ
jgi:hypothetical protein